MVFSYFWLIFSDLPCLMCLELEELSQGQMVRVLEKPGKSPRSSQGQQNRRGDATVCPPAGAAMGSAGPCTLSRCLGRRALGLWSLNHRQLQITSKFLPRVHLQPLSQGDHSPQTVAEQSSSPLCHAPQRHFSSAPQGWPGSHPNHAQAQAVSLLSNGNVLI